jgi:hypothetical protein
LVPKLIEVIGTSEVPLAKVFPCDVIAQYMANNHSLIFKKLSGQMVIPLADADKTEPEEGNAVTFLESEMWLSLTPLWPIAVTIKYDKDLNALFVFKPSGGSAIQLKIADLKR